MLLEPIYMNRNCIIPKTQKYAPECITQMELIWNMVLGRPTAN